MTILLVKPNQEAVIAKADNTLEAMQKTVGGYIEVVYPFADNVAIICNEEGKITNLPLNRALKDDDGKIYDIIAGTFFIAGLTNDDFCSLTDEQAELYLNKFKEPEAFVKVDDEILAVKINPKTKGGYVL